MEIIKGGNQQRTEFFVQEFLHVFFFCRTEHRKLLLTKSKNYVRFIAEQCNTSLKIKRILKKYYILNILDLNK